MNGRGFKIETNLPVKPNILNRPAIQSSLIWDSGCFSVLPDYWLILFFIPGKFLINYLASFSLFKSSNQRFSFNLNQCFEIRISICYSGMDEIIFILFWKTELILYFIRKFFYSNIPLQTELFYFIFLGNSIILFFLGNSFILFFLGNSFIFISFYVTFQWGIFKNFIRIFFLFY